jgi:hypothetical protein
MSLTRDDSKDGERRRGENEASKKKALRGGKKEDEARGRGQDIEAKRACEEGG